MSADAWRICPKCKHEAESNRDTRILECSKSHGKIPALQYLADLEVANKPVELEETLREDYEVFTDESGNFYFSYGCRCQNCDFHHSEKIEKKVFQIKPKASK